LNFIAGGHETMATVLAWVGHSLTIFPDIQANLREEFDAMYAQHEQGWQPGYVEIEQLPYLSNYFRELLRVYSPGKLR
jgi:cytochrome P450